MTSLSLFLNLSSYSILKKCASSSGVVNSIRGYSREKPPCDPLQPNPPCRRAYADIPPEYPCPPCDRYGKKKGILHKIKLHIIEGGTNFGTPFRWLECNDEKKEKKEEVQKVEEPKALVKVEPPVIQQRRPGVQVSVLGADTAVGQYVSLLLKQCPNIDMLRLYESSNTGGCTRRLPCVVDDLQHIDTNCRVQGFELGRCLQNSDIVLMLESARVNAAMSLEERFELQAPIVKNYAESICNECPNAFIIVCTTPIDCMVPIVAEILRSTGWYNPAKLLGSLALPEMRAGTLAARALGLEPRYTRVPCVGGTEGSSLVPLFSQAVDYFDFSEKMAEEMTNELRRTDCDLIRKDEGGCTRTSELSEAHALTKLVSSVANALLCQDIPRVTGFVETNTCQIVSPAKYLAVEVLLNGDGICHQFNFPNRLSLYEVRTLRDALSTILENVETAKNWFFWLKSLDQMKIMTPDEAYQYDYSSERLQNCCKYLTNEELNKKIR